MRGYQHLTEIRREGIYMPKPADLLRLKKINNFLQGVMKITYKLLKITLGISSSKRSFFVRNRNRPHKLLKLFQPISHSFLNLVSGLFE